VEGLLLLKLYALPSLSRQENFARVGLYENDIATLNHDYRPDLNPLFEELESHLSASDMRRCVTSWPTFGIVSNASSKGLAISHKTGASAGVLPGLRVAFHQTADLAALREPTG